MKKYISILLIAFSVASINAQGITDALRYGQENQTGTARFNAMSGSFGALGGDLSAISINPAGSVVFANNQIGFSLSNYHIKNNSTFFDTKASQRESNFDINQAGFVFIFNNADIKDDWKKFAFAINYDNTSNLNNSTLTTGTNSNSIANYFLNYANPNAVRGGIPLNALQNNSYETMNNYEDQQAYLGYNGYIINPTTTAGTNTTYTSNVPVGNNSQYNKVNSKGYNGKLVFNFATQYQNWLSLGLNLNSHFTNFTQSSFFQEQNSNATGGQVNNVLFNNELYTYGSGFSFQVGAIAKVYKGLRLGFTFDSPTWYRLNDELTQGLITNRANGIYTNASPNTTVIFEPYKLQTPMKLGGSIAYVFGKRGLLNVDVSTKNYSSMIFKPSNQFEQTNDDIASLLKSAIDLRVGGEYKIKKWSVRGGYRLEQTPYVDKKTVGDLIGYSGGLGYNFGATKLDFSYSHTRRESQQQLFSTGLTDSAQVRSIFNSFTLTLLFEL